MTDAMGHALKPGDWVELHAEPMYRFALLRVRNAHAAEELVQEAFVAALKNLASFSGRSSERTWLFGILKHKIIDWFRRKKPVKHAGSLSEDDEPDNQVFDGEALWKSVSVKFDDNPALSAERKEFHDVLDQCLEEIPTRQSKAFSLRELQNLDTNEVCEILGITPANLSVMIHRARGRLRTCLEENWDESGNTSAS